MTKLTGTAVLLAMASCGVASGDLIISVSNNIDNTLAGVTFNDGDMVRTNVSGTSASIFFAESNWTSDGDTDAFHIRDDGTYLFSSLFNSSIGGVSFDDADLIRYDPTTGTASTYVITATTFDDPFEDITGVSELGNGNLVISTLSNASIGGVSFTDGDLVEYDITTGMASILVTEAQLFDDGDGDIYGIHANADGTFLLSMNADEVISGTLFLDGDVVLYDPLADTASLFFSEAAFGGDNQRIDAVYFVPAPGAAGLLALGGVLASRRRRG